MAVTFAQGNRVTELGWNSPTLSLAFSANVGNGDLISVTAFWSDTTSTISISDSQGNTYILIGSPTRDLTHGWSGQKAYAKNVTGGPITVTLTVSSPVTSRSLIIVNIAGADPTSPLDASAGAVTSGLAGTDTLSTGPFQDFTNASLIDASMLSTTLDNASVSAGTGYTLIV